MLEGQPTALNADWARPVVHWEIVARHPERLASFYRQLFHWQIGQGPIMQVAPGLGGPEPGPAGHLRAGDHPGISLYVQVRNLGESLRAAETLGGQVLRAPFDAATSTTLAIILDPEGNRLVLVQQ